MTGSQWAILELLGSKIKTSHANTIPTGGVEFLFPDATATPAGYANLLTNGFTASLTTSNTLKAVIQVFTSPSTTMFMGNPNGGCPPRTSCPGTGRLSFPSKPPQARPSSMFCLNRQHPTPVTPN